MGRVIRRTGNAYWLDDGSLLFTAWIGQEAVALNRASGPGQLRRLGVIPHPAHEVSFSRDLKRGTLAWSDYHGGCVAVSGGQAPVR